MTFPSVRLEGSILTADLLDAIERGDKHSQKPTDFGLDPGDRVKDEIASTWATAKSIWSAYQGKLNGLKEGAAGTTETRNLFMVPFLSMLGYSLERSDAETVNNKSYAISHRDTSRDRFPVHIVGPFNPDFDGNTNRSTLDVKVAGVSRMSPHALIQEYLNLTEHLFALVSNGFKIRLLRDSSRLVKLSFLEFDLERIFGEELYADFALLFRLLHASRMPANQESIAKSTIERYHQDSVDSGSKIRDGMAAAVADAMRTIADGMLAHPENKELADSLRVNPALAEELHQNLLRWVYRSLFLLVIEERGVNHHPDATLKQRKIYQAYYSLQRLRRLSDKPQLGDARVHDLWRSMHQTLRLYEDGGKGRPLGIEPLGSFLFRDEGLQAIFKYQLDNRSFLKAFNRLSIFTHPETNVRMRVNYAALDVEEFGSIYESLLELRPRIIPDGEKLLYVYAQLAGNERKTTGSYYTPESLVQQLIKTALDPVVKEKLRAAKTPEEKEVALLSMKVCDPAVGSGHFLIAAAHRLAQRLAEIRGGDEALSPDVQRHALRDVVSHCLYGVDINPLSVELCKVSLWMLAMEPGKPLSFLDHHIRCGNSLLGTNPALIAKGIPDGAYKPLTGDDKEACAFLKKRNKGERDGIGGLFVAEDTTNLDALRSAAESVESIEDDSISALQRKEREHRKAESSYERLKQKQIADLWCAAFVWEKTVLEENAEGKCTKATGVTTGNLQQLAKDALLGDDQLHRSQQLATASRFFHWHLEFPNVFRIPGDYEEHRNDASGLCGGFDCVLGNPPWEKVEILQREWFAAKDPQFSNIPAGKEKSAQLIELKISNPQLFRQYTDARRLVDGERDFIKNSKRFPLCGHGRINSYAAFAEINLQILCDEGIAGCVLPPGIGTDDSTKLFIQHIVNNQLLQSFFGFTNRGYIFPAIESTLSFALVTYGLQKALNLKIAAQLWQVEHLMDAGRVYTLDRETIRQINPNTLNLPILQSTKDAYIVANIHRRIPALKIDGQKGFDESAIEFRQGLFNMTTDKPKFQSLEALEALGFTLTGNEFSKADKHFLPLYEAKFTSQYNYRHGTFKSVGVEDRFGTRAQTVKPNHTDLENPNWSVLPRYWVAEGDIAGSLSLKWDQRWFLGFRNAISAVADARSVAFVVVPHVGIGNSMPLLFPVDKPQFAPLLLANFNSLVVDYVTRQKASGGNLNFYVVKQLPLLPAVIYSRNYQYIGGGNLDKWLLCRVLELTYTAWDLEPFAQDYGYDGPPFRWDEERRFQLRCELDALFFHLYLPCDDAGDWKPARIAEGAVRDETDEELATLKSHFPTPRDAIAYIMETFPIVKKKDIKRTKKEDADGNITHEGTFITKDRILKIYDEMLAARRNNTEWKSPLDPPPGPPCDEEGNFIPFDQWKDAIPGHIHPPRNSEDNDVKKNG